MKQSPNVVSMRLDGEVGCDGYMSAGLAKCDFGRVSTGSVATEIFRGYRTSGETFPAKIEQSGWTALMAKKKESPQKERKPAPGPGRRYFLATMSEGLIKNLKRAAIAEDRSASQCLEEATEEWLERLAKKAPKS